MTTKIRSFSESGIEQFRIVLQRVRAGELTEIPEILLHDDASSSTLVDDIELKHRIFSTREEIVKYLFKKVSLIRDSGILYDVGLWTWLSAFYFDSICPKRGDSSRKVGEESRYILNSEEWNKYYRHLLASPTRLYKEMGALSEIYLSGKPDVPGDLFEQLASRQEIATSKGIIEAASALYWDQKEKKIKKGARNKDGAGVLRRFVQSTIPQFQMTYDLNSMSGEDIIQLLPQEYKKWTGS